jgi:hypothetical protein
MAPPDNALAHLLYRRVLAARAAPRFAFRHDAAAVRSVTSAYQRNRVARHRPRSRD